jgi:hypothetical protein
MNTYYDKMTTFVDAANEKHGTHAYAVGYLGSLASNMVYEMRLRGLNDMADYYERQLSTAITNVKESK